MVARWRDPARCVPTWSGKRNSFSLSFLFFSFCKLDFLPSSSIISRSDMPFEKTWLKSVYTSFLSFSWLFPKNVPVRMHRGDFSHLLSNCLWKRLFLSRSDESLKNMWDHWREITFRSPKDRQWEKELQSLFRVLRTDQMLNLGNEKSMHWVQADTRCWEEAGGWAPR